MRRTTTLGILTAVAFAIAPAAAQAFPLAWEVKGPPAIFEELPKGTVETLKSSGSVTFSGYKGGKPFKTAASTCGMTDEEKIENPLGTTNEGLGEMTAFTITCVASKLPPAPCVTNEAFVARGQKLPWPSLITGPSNDTFENVELEIECTTSTLTGLYHPLGYIWNPKLGINFLRSSVGAGTFRKSAGNWFTLTGTDKLIAALHTEVE